MKAGWKNPMSRLNELPSVEKLLQTEEGAGFADDYGRPLTTDAIRAALKGIRQEIRGTSRADVPSTTEILAEAEGYLRSWTKPGMLPVINATGVILHTNLGRAPLSASTTEAMSQAGRGYTNLELDLQTGKRSNRFLHADSILGRVTGAEAGMIVNNNAAAVLLALTALGRGKRVIISRTQLVEIGGGFRMPEVMRQSGAKLVEVGTTNRVRLADYAAHFAEAPIVLHAHRSNFKLIGFTQEPAFADLVEAAHLAGLMVLDDLGSGALLDTAKYGLAHEPTVQESIAAGADVVCFSGDKLVGGPQAGIIVGTSEAVGRLRKHPLARAVRPDKTILAGAIATLEHYLRDEAEREVPVWKMLASKVDDLETRAIAWKNAIGEGNIVAGQSTLGGGSLPGENLATMLLSIPGRSAEKLVARLRKHDPPVMARTEKGCVLLDPRTVLPGQDLHVQNALMAALSEAH
jgi:L-seryl-tRNA(Ser) seleniumtransferase